ncbi:hypothetical protein BSPA14S_PA0108 (plasmid) [Borreliella spielmanii A14S]|uniref:Uncharacterized protein n=1 Tax=Borreliella spielmanii A14S TaxID=498742 RepID=B9X9I6_9SPIR|nr:hypothetical protein BSPA14S_PA0108 [Borreliella spielmanii A14S]
MQKSQKKLIKKKEFKNYRILLEKEKFKFSYKKRFKEYQESKLT